MKRLLLAFALSAILLPQARAQTVLPDLSADVQLLQGDKEMGLGKMNMSKAAVRMEMKMTGMGAGIVSINRIDKNVIWTLLPNKTYMEQPLPFDPLFKNELPAGWKQDCSDGGLVEGHPTDKCVVTGAVQGQTHTTTIWKAKDLNGVVIQNVGRNGFAMKLKNIVTGPQAASLFEPPAGYKKMDVDASMAEMMKRMKK